MVTPYPIPIDLSLSPLPSLAFPLPKNSLSPQSESIPLSWECPGWKAQIPTSIGETNLSNFLQLLTPNQSPIRFRVLKEHHPNSPSHALRSAYDLRTHPLTLPNSMAMLDVLPTMTLNIVVILLPKFG